MRPIALLPVLLAVAPLAALAQPAPPEPAPAKQNANPCRDEVSAALQKLRNSSWFRMDTRMITENGPTNMQVEYILPDRMHQTVTVVATQTTSELIVVGDKSWSKQGTSAWMPLPPNVTEQLKKQMDETVLRQQTDVGDYSCKGRTQFEGRDVFSYKLESEQSKDANAPQNQTFRMFYVDALTGLPVSNALLVPGRESKPIFKTSYEFPIDMKIEPPKDVADAPAPAPAAPAAPGSPPPADTAPPAANK